MSQRDRAQRKISWSDICFKSHSSVWIFLTLKTNHATIFQSIASCTVAVREIQSFYLSSNHCFEIHQNAMKINFQRYVIHHNKHAFIFTFFLHCVATQVKALIAWRLLPVGIHLSGGGKLHHQGQVLNWTSYIVNKHTNVMNSRAWTHQACTYSCITTQLWTFTGLKQSLCTWLSSHKWSFMVVFLFVLTMSEDCVC